MPFQRQPTPFEAAVTAAPLFGGGQEPRMFSPFNVNTGGAVGMGLQLGLPILARGFMDQYGMVPSQFYPTQNLSDQFFSQQYHAQQQRAMSVAGRRDQLNLQQTMLGALRLSQGRAASPQQRQQTFLLSQDIQGMMPMLSMFLGPDTIDAMMGSRGSASIMAQQIHRGMRLSSDPYTGALGGAGRSAGTIATQLYEGLFGQGADLSQMRGMSAGQAGILFSELSLRGMGGQSLGAMRPGARFAAAAGMSFSQGEQRRIAEQALLQAGRDTDSADIERMRRQMFEPTGTQEQLQEATRSGLSGADLQRFAENLPGAEALLSGAEGQRIGERVKNLAGVVGAMRDIFGDMGRPDAPMRELINGLEALTQGGLATMNPAQLEQTVRTTRNLAQQSGLGISGMVGLQAQSANMADRLGLDRSIAVQATQGAAAFSGAARDTMRLDLPAFGGLTAEQATLLDQQLRMTGAASQAGNQLNASIRLLKTGVVKEDTDAGRLAQAIIRHQTQWTDAKGRRRSVHMTDHEWLNLVSQSGGNRSTAEAILGSTYMNQEAGRDFNTIDLARRIQREVDIVPRMSNTFAGELVTQLQSSEVAEELARQGIKGDALNDFAQRVGFRFADRVFEMDATTARTPEARQKFLNQTLRQTIEAEVRQKAAADGATPAETKARVDRALGELDSQETRDATLGMVGRLNAQITTNPQMRGLKSFLGILQMFGEPTLRAQRNRLTEAEATSQIQSSFSKLGRAGPVRRLIDAIQRAGPEENLGRLFSEIMGGVDKQELADLEAGPLGSLAEAHRMFREAERDPATGGLTDAGSQQRSRAARYFDALIDGGAIAQAALGEMAAAAGVKPEDLTATFFDDKIKTSTGPQRELWRRRKHIAASLRGAVGGDTAKKYLEKAKLASAVEVGAKEISAAADVEGGAAFLKYSNELYETLQASGRDMVQLGRGGVATLHGINQQAAEIAKLAAQAGVTPAKLLDGKVDQKHAGLVKKAQALKTKMSEGWKALGDLRQKGRIPQGPDAFGAHEEAMLEELAKLHTGTDFFPTDGKSRTGAQFAEAVAQSRATHIAKDLFGRLQDSSAFLKGGKLTTLGLDIVADMRKQGRVGGTAEALSARKQLLKIAAERGVTVGGAKLTGDRLKQLSPAEQQEALDALRGLKLGGETERLFQAQDPLKSLGARGEDALPAVKARLNQITASDPRTQRSEAKKPTVQLAGKVRIENPEVLSISGELISGGLDHNDVETQLVGVPWSNV